jgi:hypothetical protein
MTDVPCESCGLPVSEAALAAGACPCCGHRVGDAPASTVPAPEPAPVSEPPARPAAPRGRWRLPAVAAAALAAGVAAGYPLFAPSEVPAPPAPEVVAAPRPAAPAPPQVVPMPVLFLLPAAPAPEPQPTPAAVAEPAPAQPAAVAVAPAPRAADGAKPAAPPGPLDVVASRDGLVRRVVAADGAVTVEVADLNGGDVVTLTGRVTVLRLAGVNGRGRVDASRLTAETVILAGDLNGDSEVAVAAGPGGKVTVGGLNGRARLAVAAPGGEVVFAKTSDDYNGEAAAVVAARRVDVGGGMNGGARLTATLDRGGSLRVGTLNSRAEVVYRRAAASDPAPAVETGQLLGDSRVIEGK